MKLIPLITTLLLAISFPIYSAMGQSSERELLPISLKNDSSVYLHTNSVQKYGNIVRFKTDFISKDHHPTRTEKLADCNNYSFSAKLNMWLIDEKNNAVLNIYGKSPDQSIKFSHFPRGSLGYEVNEYICKFVDLWD